ncbi:hypothetical protein AVEN_93036-1 [Araneus ventricosus]|uniref:Uncharacterized protein n=1 Tax=Araneus ventricosus TaxID=182803 RepID=A0A4Y2NDN2_ARAVE|nr:hypothetical protein AVEN_93036-1 [Araneus ventricosus]
MFIPNLKEVFELVFKNEYSIIISRTNSDIFFSSSTCLTLYHVNRCVFFPYAVTEQPQSILYGIWYVKNILPNFLDNPNSLESEQRSASISSDSRCSTVQEDSFVGWRGIKGVNN